MLAAVASAENPDGQTSMLGATVASPSTTLGNAYGQGVSQNSSGSSILQPGPYNPAATLPCKLVKKILDLEFVEMADISLDDPPTPAPGQPPLPTRPPIQNLSIWVEKFSIMAALLASRYPHKAPELFAYQAAIVRAERNFEDQRWVIYDSCYRREALVNKDLDWSVPNACLYNEAFTGRARAIPRCNYCLQEDHATRSCSLNPNRSWVGWIPGSLGDQPPSAGRQPSLRSPATTECCRRYNAGRCKQPASACRYTHRCTDCNGPHPRLQCPRGGQKGSGQARSPLRQGQQTNHGTAPGPLY